VDKLDQRILWTALTHLVYSLDYEMAEKILGFEVDDIVMNKLTRRIWRIAAQVHNQKPAE
jgi:hypothetical protein